MLHRPLQWLPLAILLLGVGAWAEDVAPPAGVLAAGDARLTLLRDGCWLLTRGDATLVAHAQVVVAGVGWKGTGSQSASRVAVGFPKKAGKAFLFAGEVDETASKTTWRFTQRVEPAADGFRFVYEIQPLKDTQVAEVSLFLDLPLAQWRGKGVALWRRREAVFPVKRPARRHFLSGTARKAVLDAGAERQLAFHFAKPTMCTVQDCREFKNNRYQLYARLFRGGAIKAGRVCRLEFTLAPSDSGSYLMKPVSYASKQPLRIGKIVLPTPTVPTCQRLEVALDITGTWDTPFDADQVSVDAHVTTPSGREMVVPAFYWQDYELLREDEDSWLEGKGEPSWKVRLAATEVGKHTMHIVARDRSGEVRSDPVAFTATDSGDLGYIRVSRKDRRYWAFDDGTPYFAVGENVSTWRHGLTEYDEWLPALGKAGGNYARIWMYAHCFGIDWGKPGHYRLDHAWALDHAMALAEKHGIRVKLCLEAWRHFEGPRSFVRAGVAHPYSTKNGGPCSREMDVFTHPEAKRMFRNRLRYVVARWGYSTHILAWELWNEINCVAGYHQRSGDVMAWTREMARHLKAIDPWRHMVVNSLGSFLVDDRMWEAPEVDFAQVHGYWHPTHKASKDMGKDMAEFVPHWIGKIRGYGKPALFAEYGLVNPRWGHNRRANDDKQGVHLHNGLWSSVMSGACGTAMLWWWGVYVHPNDLYFQFGTVARYVDGVPWTTAGFEPIEPKTNSPQLRAMALRGDGLTLLWVHNRRHTWWNVVEKQPIPAIDSASVALDGLKDGEYTVEWWDTWKGAVTRTQTLEAKAGVLSVPVSNLARDAAAKIVPR